MFCIYAQVESINEGLVHIPKPHYLPNVSKLTLKVLVATTDAQWEGMGIVGLARYEPALLPPCPK